MISPSSLVHPEFRLGKSNEMCLMLYITRVIICDVAPEFALGNGVIVLRTGHINPLLPRWIFYYVVIIISPFVHVFMRVLL